MPGIGHHCLRRGCGSDHHLGHHGRDHRDDDRASTATTLRSEGEASVEFTGEVQAGTEFDVTWSGPDNEGDFVTIVAAGAREGAFEDYFETSEGATGILFAPTTPGDYEIRYVDGASNETLASVPISVKSPVITLELPVTVAAGTAFEVTWEAVEASGDSITIVAADAAEATFESYFYTEDGPTGTLVAPIVEGDYEIRYLSGADPGAYLSYEYMRGGSPLTLIAPVEPGEYELRYRSDRVGDVFFSVPITVE